MLEYPYGTISSQARQECVEGSTTNAWSPDRTVKRHERGTKFKKSSKDFRNYADTLYINQNRGEYMAEKKFFISAEELRSAYEEFGSTIKVANKYGVSKKLILNYMKRFEIKRNQRQAPEQLAKKIVELIDYEDLDSKQISERLNISLVQINKCIKKFNIDIRRYHKGFKIDERGYKHIKCPDHPNSSKSGYIREHILVMSNFLGRPINDEEEVVHHINERKRDNRIENLQLMSHYDHKCLHSRKPRKKSLNQTLMI